MSEETIVAVYDKPSNAEAAVNELVQAHIPRSGIRSEAATTTADSTDGLPRPPREPGFWSNLFGGEPDHDTAVYDRSVSAGSTVVTVTVPNELAANASEILDRHDPVDLDERAAGYGLGASTTVTTTETTGVAAPRGRETADHGAGEQVLALSEEQLSVGKRMVNHGTTRIRRFVVETPVEENVTLQSERVSVERRAASPSAHATDLDFTDRVIEVTETDEEAVIGKSARVREEVVIRKEVTDRVETVRDTVRREDVEITRDGAARPVAKSARPGI